MDSWFYLTYRDELGPHIVFHSSLDSLIRHYDSLFDSMDPTTLCMYLVSEIHRSDISSSDIYPEDYCDEEC